MVEPNLRGGDVALFIDWENFKISLAAGNRSPNLSSLKEEVSNQGRVVVAKAYADWVTRAPELRGASQFFNDPPSLYAAGIEPVFVPTRIPSTQASSANGMRTYRVKNSVDVKMTADCIECAHSYPNIVTFVLVSGDSDFLHVVNALRTMGKRVVVVGVSWSTSRRLADQVDSLLLYDKDIDPLAPQPAVLPQHVMPQQAAASDDAPELPAVLRAIEDIIREERAAGGNPLLTSIKQRLMRRYPSFDEKKLGFSGFKKLMARTAEDGNIKLIHAGLVDWAIMADEETPEGTIEESPSGVASRPSRRRGGRRRGQRDADASDADAADVLDEDAAEPEDQEDQEVDIPDYDPDDVAPGFVGELEETAATDFDLPETVAADAPDSPEAVEPEAPVAWFDADEEATAAVEATTVEPEEVPDGVQPEDVFANDANLASAVQEIVASFSLPAGPEDGLNSERVSDLIVMADYLEHQQGASHVAFNYLLSEVCNALDAGLAAGDPQIAQRWSDVGAKDYVTRALRGLADNGFFRRARYSWREEDTGRRRQRQTFNLDRNNDLVGRVLIARLGSDASAAPPAEDSDAAALVSPDADSPEPPQPLADDTQPVVEQLSLVNGDNPAETEEAEEAEPTVDSPAAPVGDDQDEVFDEPQPRSTRRRRPFTSRLLRS